MNQHYCVVTILFWVLIMLSAQPFTLKPDWCHEQKCETLPEKILLNKDIH